ADAAFTKVYEGTLEGTDGWKEVPLSAVVDAKYVQFFWKNAYPGNPYYIGVRDLEVLSPNDSGASLVGFSSQVGETNSPRAALDLEPTGYWQTANGQNTNQWLKLLMPGAGIWLI